MSCSWHKDGIEGRFAHLHRHEAIKQIRLGDQVGLDGRELILAEKSFWNLRMRRHSLEDLARDDGPEVVVQLAEHCCLESESHQPTNTGSTVRSSSFSGCPGTSPPRLTPLVWLTVCYHGVVTRSFS
jgi:hypothetical protein